MYFGHLAIAGAVKAKEPDVPVLPIMLGTGVLDILNGLFIMGGLDKVSPNLKALPYLFFDLTYIDWDHSLFMAIIWCSLFGAIFWKNKKVAIVVGLTAFSHFLADIPLHNYDMALFPNSNIKLGMGLWGTMGVWSWVLEVLFSGVLLLYAYKKSKNQGKSIILQIAFIVLLAIQMSPWLSPMKKVAQLGEPYTHLLHGFLVCTGFLIPAFLLTWLYKRSDSVKKVNLK